MANSLRFLFPAILTAIMLAVLLALGFWQVDRLAWKQDLLARIEARQKEAPLTVSSAADVAALTRAGDEYRRALLRGRFAPQQGFWFTQIESRPPGLSARDAAGYHILAPFTLADGGTILVDRGFVPARLKDQAEASPSAVQRLDVILRWPDRRGAFDNDDKPEAQLFYVRDPQAIGAHWQIDLPPLIGEVVAPGAGWPRGGQTRMQIANNHLQYAGTWFGLAIVLVIVSGLWHIRLMKSRQTAHAQADIAAGKGDEDR